MVEPAVFSAVSTSVRQLYLLLRCISFGTKAEVQITSTGIRFSVHEARVVQGLTFLEKSLFTSYNLNPGDDSTRLPRFEISLAALLETLQIFGISETTSSNPGGGFSSSYTNAFTAPSLAMGGTCRISYAQVGSPLSITIQEGAVTTTCDINTYAVGADYDDEGIPFDRNSICLKIIMRSAWLQDAITDLAEMNVESVVINASERSQPYFCIEGLGGPFGDVTIDYLPESKTEPMPGGARSKKQPSVTETFVVASLAAGMHGRLRQRYKFGLIKKASRAMALASKVSIRQDVQGVLSLQFMIELGGVSNGAKGGHAVTGAHSGKVYFVDFRLVPLCDDGDEHESEEGEQVEDGEESEP